MEKGADSWPGARVRKGVAGVLDKWGERTIIGGVAAHAKISQEVEAKLLAPRAAVLTAIARVKSLGPYRLRPRQTAHLHTIYLDTREFTLARHGVALRLRRNRARWEASAKWSGREDGSIHERPELTVPLPHAPSFPFTLPPGPLVTHLSGLVAEQGLAPILISDVRRQRFAVLLAQRIKDPAFAELALDQVRLSAPGSGRRAAITYCEVEIELEPGGAVQELCDFAELLRARFALTPVEDSKFSRGLALLYGPGLIGSERTDQKRQRAARVRPREAARQRPAAKNKASPPTAQQ